MNHKEDFLNELRENKKIIRYRQLENIVNNNEEINQLFNELKNVQKQLVNAQNINKTNAINAFTKQYNEIYDKLITYPLVSEYLALQSEINDFLGTISKIIEDGINNDLL